MNDRWRSILLTLSLGQRRAWRRGWPPPKPPPSRRPGVPRPKGSSSCSTAGPRKGCTRTFATRVRGRTRSSRSMTASCISGDGMGGVSTRHAYRDYHMICEFRWGAGLGTAPDRKDSGVLVRSPRGRMAASGWSRSRPRSSRGTGDFIVVRGNGRCSPADRRGGQGPRRRVRLACGGEEGLHLRPGQLVRTRPGLEGRNRFPRQERRRKPRRPVDADGCFTAATGLRSSSAVSRSTRPSMSTRRRQADDPVGTGESLSAAGALATGQAGDPPPGGSQQPVIPTAAADRRRDPPDPACLMLRRMGGTRPLCVRPGPATAGHIIPAAAERLRRRQRLQESPCGGLRRPRRCPAADFRMAGTGRWSS